MAEVRHVLAPRAGRRAADEQAGFTLFELVVVICAVAVMAGLLLDRMQVYQEAAEKAAMRQTAAAIKSALQMRIASYMISGRDREIEQLHLQNPISWLQEPPAEYAGEFHADAYERVRPGSWYFDLRQRELVYVINLGANFKPGPDGRKWVRYRVKIEYEEAPQKDAPPRKVLSAANFSPVQSYVWF